MPLQAAMPQQQSLLQQNDRQVSHLPLRDAVESGDREPVLERRWLEEEFMQSPKASCS
jgi:hypothetical protein